MCLIAGKEKDQCTHKWCMMVAKKPQYFGGSINDLFARYAFSEFEYIDSKNPHLIPHKPVDAPAGFEMFRQAQNSVVYLCGEWPSGLDLVPREHVEIKWAEYVEHYVQYNEEMQKNEWLERVNVDEFAFYVGPGAQLQLTEAAQ